MSKHDLFWWEYIKSYKTSSTGVMDYGLLLKDHPLTDDDLIMFVGMLAYHMNSGSLGYDTFCDAGGMKLAALLLAEVRRMRGLS